MFERMTFEYLINKMLGYVDDSLDKREGSIIYTALAPAALEMADMYYEADVMLKQSFIGTAVSNYLDMKVAEFGFSRKPASRAIVKGQFNVNVEIGNRFNGGKWNYVVSKLINASTHEYELECEMEGSYCNDFVGALIPVEFIDGLKKAEITALIVPGEDAESDEELRERFFNSIKNQRSDGNVAQYLEWINEFPGIGKGKVISLWNGANTVKVIILDAKNQLASDELVEKFQEFLDPEQRGLGNGKAPIGAKVTVATAAAKQISIDANIVLSDGYSNADGARESIEELFSEIALSRNKIGYMEIGARLQALVSCKWVRDLKVNNGVVDIDLSEEEIPSLSRLNLKVVS